MERDFAQDFLIYAIAGMDRKTAARVACAMDCAIAFGALEYRDGNESLKTITNDDYQTKVDRLKKM
jgi:hypothetical protein